MPAHRAGIIAIALLGACAHPRIGTGVGTPGGGEARETANERCLLSTGSAASRKPVVTIGLTDVVDPRHAPVPTNDAERLVFRHLYETPVRFDCDGRPVADLAEKWVKDDDGRRWTFRVRDDAQFWDGAPVTAQDIVFGRGGAGYTLGALETRVVTMTLARPSDDLPALLGDPGLALAKPAPDSSWPIGTGRFWATSATTTAQEIRAQNSRGDTLVFRFAPGGDARDLLDGGVDLLVTRDRALRDYAATLKDLTVVALPWDRTYVYITPEPGGTRFDGLEQAVRAEARRPEGGFWWLDLRACGISNGVSPPVSSGQRRILYSRSDPTARALAGRLAALTRAVATARAPDELEAAVMNGKDWGYVVALPRVTTDPCRTARNLLPQWAATITALVDTRPTAIVRRGVARWVLDRDGTVHLDSSP
ncbi:MAG TPA: ABC transporter substrate-binding protein [Gemmatimonadales bacterium]|nr:ABC transporter substrate-binding protein [Gemmatimonadales bacterium]